MGEAAIKAARAVDYVGAGTVEFLLDDETREFYFLEMNTRLQVEHPVTELVTGIDLVREQINVAAGMPLSFRQQDVIWGGHAIECRVYAEDPANNFLPSPGRISRLRVPAGPGVRDDSGVTEGAEVSIYYDPMVSKLAAWGRTRTEAIDRLRRALDEYDVAGIKTTLPFFRAIVRDREFIDGKLDTGFIPRFLERTDPFSTGSSDTDESQETEACDMAVIAAAIEYHARQKRLTAGTGTPTVSTSRWRLAGRDPFTR
jgi:acetyl/propionyl-CoA carboxylase alpha subunit